ncbi:MAG TPA: tetratricopeptide repeat protein [Chloroflexia bacterium]|nr:tetratricopeptide repeat protein [Chloroflexia bacterium]
MTKTLSAYLPQDRQQALLRGTDLPERSFGSALFADISGFTPLTEKLTRQFGDRRGIEELARRINTVYDTLIRLIETQNGSVICFAGDSITCWFTATEENASSTRVISAALAMQEAMQAFEEISLKIAITSGTICRFVVGDPQIQLLDTLAGQTVARVASAEHFAGQGEIVADRATIEAFGEGLQVGEWRQESETGEEFGLIGEASARAENHAATGASSELPLDLVRPWVLPNVYTREQNGLGEFLTEFRPAAVLFLRFGGIDYDGDSAAQLKLNAFIKQAQQIIAGFDGALLQLTIGDKGSYMYACFGAPTAHEDDARRAVNAALALRELPQKLAFLQPVQIGISQGVLRAGAYGGATRRTYGALGDEVNLAARLMSLAEPGEILVSSRIRTLLDDQFILESHFTVTVKGKQALVSVSRVKGVARRRATRLLEPEYRLPMIGRQEELNLVTGKLELVRQGKGQIIGITAEAGLGKSRLVAEVLRQAQSGQIACYGGACEATGTSSAYLVWKAIWQAFFEVDQQAGRVEQVRQLESKLAQFAPQRLPALPLLRPLLDIPLEDNEFTRNLEPKDRFSALEALLEDFLKAASRAEPILIVLEDLHWIDALSHDLLVALGRATANSAVCFVLAYRPVDLERLQAPQIEALPHFSRMELAELGQEEVEQLIRAKVTQLFPPDSSGAALNKALLKELTTRGQGNPFFLEELLNYLHDRDISPYDKKPLKALELPSSLHSLILSRIDRLSEAQKVILKVASIIGRLFPFAWLQGYYPVLGPDQAVKADLNTLARLDITPLDTPEPELAYLFKHFVTQEVPYESMPYATRAQLHQQLAAYLEDHGYALSYDLLAFHYGRSENRAKQIEYFQKAADAAREAYANETALDYYERLVPLLSERVDQIDAYLKYASVLVLLGRNDELEEKLQLALELAAGDTWRQAQIQQLFGVLYRRRGEYTTAIDWFEQARVGWESSGDKKGLAQLFSDMGQLFFQKGDFEKARETLEEGLALARQIGEKGLTAEMLKISGNIAAYKGDYQAARKLYNESLPLKSEIGDKRGLNSLFNNLGNVAFSEGDFQTASEWYAQSLALARQIGDKTNIPITLSNLGLVHKHQGNYTLARALMEEGLLMRREMGEKWSVAESVRILGTVALYAGELVEAGKRFEEALTLSRETGDKTSITQALHSLGNVILLQGDLNRAHQLLDESMVLAREINDPRSLSQVLHLLGELAFQQGDYSRARALLCESLTIRREIGMKAGMVDTLIMLAAVIYQEARYSVAVQLAAAAESVSLSINFKSDLAIERIYQETMAEAKKTLGEEAYQAAFESGQKMALEEAYQLAVGE